MPESIAEPWLRGGVPDVHPVISHLLRSSEQIREDVAKALSGLSVEQLWARPEAMTSGGFHAKHLAGSTGRLCSYLEGRQLSEAELAAMDAEGAGDEPAAELIGFVFAAFDRYDLLIRGLDPVEFEAVREVGRLRIQASAIGLAIHIIEHGHRHVGQAITAANRTGR